MAMFVSMWTPFLYDLLQSSQVYLNEWKSEDLLCKLLDLFFQIIYFEVYVMNKLGPLTIFFVIEYLHI